MKRAAKITIATGVALIVLAVIGRLVLGAYAPKPVKPSAGGYLGVAEAGETTSYQPVDDFTAAVGRKPDIVLYYSTWKRPFKTRFAAQVHAHGATPFVQIDPGHTSLATIASGRDDAFVRSYADQVRAYGHPVIIGFAAEMNGDWDAWGYRHTPARVFVAAWRHLVTVFRQQGAGNVIWLWTVDLTEQGTGPIQDWWPGAGYVTWVGIDGYYYERGYTFENAFLPTIAEVRIFTRKPILLSETGVGQVAGQAAKIPDLFAGVRANHLLGLVWFDQAQANGLYHQNWRLEGNPAGLAAFREALKTYKEPQERPGARLLEDSRSGTPGPGKQAIRQTRPGNAQSSSVRSNRTGTNSSSHSNITYHRLRYSHRKGRAGSIQVMRKICVGGGSGGHRHGVLRIPGPHLS